MLSSLRLCKLPIPGGNSSKLLLRKLRTFSVSSLKSSSGNVARELEAKNNFKLGSIWENTPSATGGIHVNVLSGLIVAFDRLFNPRDLIYD